VEQRIGNLELAAELSHREKRRCYRTTISAAFLSKYLYRSRQTQFSPRLRHLAPWNGLLNEFVAGVDLIRWERKHQRLRLRREPGFESLYLRDEMRFGGAQCRAWPSARATNASTRTSERRLFVRTGEAVAKRVELQGSIDVMPASPCSPRQGRATACRTPTKTASARRRRPARRSQTSRDLELGVTCSAPRALTARVFRHRLRTRSSSIRPWAAARRQRQPRSDPPPGRRDRRRRRPAANLRLSGHLQHVQAEFTDGPNAGREMVLVPKNVLTARLAWLPAANGHSFDVGAQYGSSQRYGSDFGNSCGARIPSYTTIDARYAIKAWRLGVRREWPEPGGPPVLQPGLPAAAAASIPATDASSSCRRATTSDATMS
jgi:iron complex outermembrane receptor protein